MCYKHHICKHLTLALKHLRCVTRDIVASFGMALSRYLNQLWIVSIGHLWTNFIEIWLKKNDNFIYENAFENVILKMAVNLSRPQYSIIKQIQCLSRAKTGSFFVIVCILRRLFVDFKDKHDYDYVKNIGGISAQDINKAI